jgi:hypothetical protein
VELLGVLHRAFESSGLSRSAELTTGQPDVLFLCMQFAANDKQAASNFGVALLWHERLTVQGDAECILLQSRLTVSRGFSTSVVVDALWGLNVSFVMARPTVRGCLCTDDIDRLTWQNSRKLDVTLEVLPADSVWLISILTSFPFTQISSIFTLFSNVYSYILTQYT